MILMHEVMLGLLAINVVAIPAVMFGACITFYVYGGFWDAVLQGYLVLNAVIVVVVSTLILINVFGAYF